MKFVNDWRNAARWWSMRGLAVIASLPLIWMALPPDLKTMIPPDWHGLVVSAVAVGTAIGRLKDQGGSDL